MTVAHAGQARQEEFVRRLAAATRALSLYAPTHPIVRRGTTSLVGACAHLIEEAGRATLGFLGTDIIVNDRRLRRIDPQLAGLARSVAGHGLERITIEPGVTADELGALVTILASTPGEPVADRLRAKGVSRITVGVIEVEENEPSRPDLAAARKVYHGALETAAALWQAAQATGEMDTGAAQSVVGTLARMVSEDRTPLMALTALKKYDSYTFTHMVNVSVLTMAMARSLGIQGAMLREFGLAALMHDIGKVRTPLDVLNKPGKLSNTEFDVMKRHVIDGADILRRLPQMPALASIVAFEHHLKQDLTGYPRDATPRSLNLCTMIVTVADVFDALRTNRPYRQGLASDRVRTIMGEQHGTAFHPVVLRRFVSLVGLFPVGTLVLLNTGELGVVTHEHPTDPFRPQVKIVFDPSGQRLDEPTLANTWERDARGEYPRAVVDAADEEAIGIDPLAFL